MIVHFLGKESASMEEIWRKRKREADPVQAVNGVCQENNGDRIFLILCNINV